MGGMQGGGYKMSDAMWVMQCVEKFNPEHKRSASREHPRQCLQRMSKTGTPANGPRSPHSLANQALAPALQTETAETNETHPWRTLACRLGWTLCWYVLAL
eukprot:1159302-Pelagomonas_calceolata.AAC.19